MVTRAESHSLWKDTRKAKHRWAELPSLLDSPRQMMTILTEFGVESRIEDEDYLQGLVALRKG